MNTSNSKHLGIASLVLSLSFLVAFGLFTEVHPGLMAVVVGPAVITIAAAFGGAAARSGSKWWLLTLLVPWLAVVFIAIFLGGSHV